MCESREASHDDSGTGVARGYRLLGAARAYYWSERKGAVGGNRRGALYGRLDCPAALHALSRPSAATFRRFRVFFADEATAQAAGFRPCSRCLPAAYKVWKAGPQPGAAYPWARHPEEPAPRVRASPSVAVDEGDLRQVVGRPSASYDQRQGARRGKPRAAELER